MTRDSDQMQPPPEPGKRTIMLHGSIGDAEANDCIARLLYFQSCDRRAPVTITVNSPGGSVVAGLAICDTIKIVAYPVPIFCEGLAAGIAVHILAAGQRGMRGATPDAHLGLVRPTFNGPVSGVEEPEASELQRLGQRLADALATDTRIARERYADLLPGSSIWFRPQEALQLGIVDYIDRVPRARSGIL
jgi:ATP-dependent Clp protease, protease subunit